MNINMKYYKNIPTKKGLIKIVEKDKNWEN